MGTKYPEIFAGLAAEFAKEDLRYHDHLKFWYVTPRAVANRLDEVLGPENWDGEPLPWNETAVKYKLTITLPDGSKVTKYSLGAKSTMSVKSKGKTDAGDDEKGGDSDGLKRAAAMFGVARYLYNDGVVNYGTSRQQPRQEEVRTQAEKLYGWAKRNGHLERAIALARRNYGADGLGELPDEAALAIYNLIKGSRAQTPAPPPQRVAREPGDDPPDAQAVNRPHGPGRNGNANPVTFGWPTSFPAFYRWMKNMEESFHTKITTSVIEGFCGKHLAEDKRWDRDMKSWSLEQIEEAALYVAGLVKLFPGYTGEFDPKLKALAPPDLAPPDLGVLRDSIWATAAALTEALGSKPTTESITMQIQQTAQIVSSNHGGELPDPLEQCTNVGLLEAILTILKSDLEDAKVAF